MSEARIGRKKRGPSGPMGENRARGDAMKDATPDAEPPWSIKTMKQGKDQGKTEKEEE